MNVSKCSCDETVKNLGVRKNDSCVARDTVETEDPVDRADFAESVKTSPAPSQSEDVIDGGCTLTKS